ncbi:MAG TPA: cyclic nucleotide-binding domain-containing protein [Nocardioidaceae bacterium]
MPAPASVRALSENRGLRRTMLAYLLYDVVEIAIWLAIILWAFAEGGAALAGLVAVVQLVPAALLSPLLASFGDRMSRGTALVVGYLAVTLTTGLTAVTVVVDAPVAVVTAASATATTALAVARPLHFAALPQLARGPDQLVAANALSSVSDGVALFVGPVVAGVGAQFAGPWLVLGGGTLMAGSAALLCRRLGLGAPVAVADEPRGWRAAFSGLGVIWRDVAVTVLLLVLTVRFVVEGAMDLLGVSIATEVLELGESGAGVVIGSVGLGGLVGGAVAGVVARRRRLAPVLLASGVLLGLGVALVALVVSFVPVVVLLAFAGLGGAVLMVAGRTLLQRTCDDGVLARVFAVQEATALLALALGVSVAPFVIDRLGPAGAFAPFGLGAVVLIVAGFLLVRGLDDRSVWRPVEAELLRRVPFLAVLPPYELEQLARSAAWADVEPGEEVVRQGEPGDRFYVVAEGELQVAVDGEVRPARLGPGDGFGEIALLRAVPRTATVTARSRARLLVVSAGDFLAAVTGHPDGHALASEVAAAHLAADRDEAD